MTRLSSLLAFSLAASALPSPVSAQDPSASAPRLRVETIESGWVIAPDAKFTEINDRSATLAGVYGGWLSDRTLFAGAGAYWLVDRHEDFKVAYGGPIVGVLARGDRRLAFGVRTLVGFGNATLSDTYGALVGDRIRFGARGHPVRGGRPFPTESTRLVFEDNFFIAEPQVNAVWRVTNWLGIDAGVGYRVIAGSELLDDRLKGLSGSIALQFGR
jgi:hypothetical protein